MGDRLATAFLGQRLTTPLVLPAGVIGMSFSSLKRAVESGAGMVTTKSFTIEPRAGHRGPVVAEFDGGLMNCMGLCNPGIDDGLKEITEFRRVCTAPVIVSVFGTTESEFATLARSVAGSEADFIELNLSCPNVGREFGGPIASSPKTVHAMTAAAKDESSIPVIAKLSPNTDDIAAVARAAVDAGAEAAGIGEQNVHNKEDNEWLGGVQIATLFPFTMMAFIRFPLRPAGWRLESRPGTRSPGRPGGG